MSYTLRIILLFIWLGTYSSLYAQNKPGAGFGYEVSALGGGVFKHTQKFTLPLPDLCTAYEINLQWKTHGTKDWQQRLHFPTWGIGFCYTDYGINAIYGKAIGIYPNLELPFARGKNWEWVGRAGFGIGIISKHYSRYPDFDTQNVAIASNINNFTLFTTDLRYHINSHWDAQLGLNFSHISNGTYHVPNLGINMYGGHVGIRYFPVTSRPVNTIKDLKPLSRRWLLEGCLSMGKTEYGPPLGPVYNIYLATLYVSKRLGSKYKVYAGLDYSYHQDIYVFLRNNEIYPGEEAQHAWKSAVLGGSELNVGRFGIICQIGVYIHEAALRQDPYYEKVGTHIYLLQREKGAMKELFLSAMLKTHKTNAEVAEFGLGLGF